MKKALKIVRNYIGKYLLKILVKLKKFNLFPLFIKIFPKEIYRASSQLMRRGYLDLSYEIVKNYTPKQHEIHIVERIISMYKIKNDGLPIRQKQKSSIEKINVLFAVHNSFPYDKAGYAIRTHSIVTNLISNGTKAIVATRAGYPWDLQKHRDLDSSIKENEIDGVKYLRLSDDNKTFKKGSDFNYIKTYSDELVKTVKEYGTTILHAHSNYLNALSAINASNELGIPSIYEIRGLWHVTKLTKDQNYKYNGMFEYEQEMVKGAAISADAVVTISQALKDLIVSWGIDSKKITVIPNAVDISLFNPQPKLNSLVEKYHLKNKITIGFIGSLTAYEGLEYLISAVEDLINDGYNLSLLIVGDGDEKKKLESLTTSQQIIFTGRVSHADVEKYYSIFDICIYPRNNYDVCRYVPPLKPLEAMAMKKAVIVSDVAPLLEIIEDKKNGLVCKADDKESLKETIKLLYNDIGLREELAINGYNWVKEYRSWDLIVKKYIKLYNSFKKTV